MRLHIRTYLEGKGLKTSRVKCVPHMRTKLANKINLSIRGFSKATKENVDIHGHPEVLWEKKKTFAESWIETIFISDIVSEYLV